MPWSRLGDNSATYPALMALAADPAADERTVNEVFGWLLRCAFQSAAHMTDYVIDVGTAYMMGGASTDELVRMAKAVGLLTDTTVKGLPAFELIQDPEFIHIRLRQEIEWERQQRADTRTENTKLGVPVRLRDGDQCRWCGLVVQWRGSGKSARKGTLDHLVPGEAGTVETLVVACKGCNGARGQNRDLFDDNHRLLDVPTRPLYGKWTAAYLANNGFPVEVNILSDDVSAAQAATPATVPSFADTPNSVSASASMAGNTDTAAVSFSTTPGGVIDGVADPGTGSASRKMAGNEVESAVTANPASPSPLPEGNTAPPGQPPPQLVAPAKSPEIKTNRVVRTSSAGTGREGNTSDKDGHGPASGRDGPVVGAVVGGAGQPRSQGAGRRRRGRGRNNGQGRKPA